MHTPTTYGTNQVRYALDDVDHTSKSNLNLALYNAKLMVKRAEIVQLEIEAHISAIRIAAPKPGE